MNTINFEKPILAPDLPRPKSISNQSFLYNAIASPRRFEELLYSIYDQKIKSAEITDFDEVNLMTGVHDQGRDCCLMRGGKTYGLIQCKKYEKNYSKEEFGLEIVRFALYSLLDERLIADRKDFTYYIAVSKGFTAECGKFIDNFSANIASEPNLDEWIEKNLKLPTLKPLALTLNRKDFLELMCNLKVKKIIPQDLDAHLSSACCQHLIPLFFEVRTVMDSTEVKELLEEYLDRSLSPDDLLNELKIGSARLRSERNTFQNIDDSHIERRETKELYDWIDGKLEKKDQVIKNVCLLAAQAGYGKTVVLKDLYSLCLDSGFAVLGLKADKLYSNSVTALQQNLGFSKPVYAFIEECKQHFSRVVILIDQIDALSQSMSSDRSYLELYRSFIDHFANDDCIRFVVSVRTADLHYDPSLKVYKNIKIVRLGLLDEDQILSLLQKIGISRSDISAKLLELLKVPNHLDVFSQIVSGKNIPQATSILDLYFELWTQKVTEIKDTAPVRPERVKELLYLIAKKMFDSQRISVPVIPYESFVKELHYLESERLIKIEDKQLQFFHQSFYDFVFAKRFVEENHDLLAYIKTGEQSLHIHSAVKMIISYLRDYDPAEFYQVINRIFSDSEILFQIKHILMVTILALEKPTAVEVEFVLDAFASSFHWQSVFFDHALSKPWLHLAKEKSFFSVLADDYQVSSEDKEHIKDFHLLKAQNAAIDFLRRFILQDDADAWEAFAQINKDSIIRPILSSVTVWTNPIAYQMFEKMEDFEVRDEYGYYYILSHIARVNPSYVLAKLNEILPTHFKKNSSRREYKENDALKVLSQDVPQLLFPVLYHAMKTDFEREQEQEDGLITDWAYSYVDFRDSDDLFGSEYLYQLLALCLKRTARGYSQDFIAFFNAHKHTRYQAMLRLLLFALQENEQHYPDQIFELFGVFKRLDLLNFRDEIQNEMRTLLEKTFSYFKPAQKEFVIDTIRNYTYRKELSIFRITDQERKFVSKWGLSKYYLIRRLPAEVIETEFKKEYQQLQRLFEKGIYTDEPRRRRVLAGVVTSPISLEKCSKMNVRSWLNAFKKYDRERYGPGDDFLKGGLTELASTFQATVKQYPTNDKLQVIAQVIDDATLPLKYAINGLWGWTEGGGSSEAIIPLAKKVLNKLDKEDSRICITIISRLIGSEQAEPEFVDYLIKTALDFREPDPDEDELETDSKTSISGLVMKAVNTTYGSAAHALVQVRDPKFEDAVFDTMQKIFENGPRESRAGAYYEYAYLLNLNKDRAIDTFLSGIEKEEDTYVVASAIWSFQYMRSYGFIQLIPVFRRIILSGKLGEQDGHMLFMTLYASYLHGQAEAEELLNQIIDSNKEIRSGAIREILKYYYEIENSKEKNDALLHRILKNVTEEESSELRWNFIEASHLKLQDIYAFLKPFVQSKFFKISDYFVNYMILQLSHYPFQAVELFEMAVNNKGIKEDPQGSRTDEKAIIFIVNAFNGINESTEEARAIRRKLLIVFGTLLQDFRQYQRSEKILEELM